MVRSRSSSRLAACALALAATAALGADPLSNRSCADGVCMANVDARHAVEPCRDANLVIAWSQLGGAMAIQCWTDAPPEDQPMFVFDRRAVHGPTWELAGMRAFAPDSLPQLANRQRHESDAMPQACQAPRPATMAPGELLLTEKVASDDARRSTCVRILRVASGAKGLAISADDGRAPAPARESVDWSALAAKMSALAAQVDAQARAHVTRVRAPLRDAPEPKSAPHGWLVKGDAVVVLDRAAGLAKVLYVGRDGKAIERWVAQGDIALDAVR
jgi:hypothetical protein